MPLISLALRQSVCSVSALGLFVDGNVITALALDLNTLLVGSVLASLGAAMFAPTALGVGTSIADPERRGRALSTATSGLAGMLPG